MLVSLKKMRTFASHLAGESKKIAKIAQLVEHDLAKVGVAGSSPVFRSKPNRNVRMAELVDALL